uniref:Ovule protein n=1 Tax=Panagrellus redivivus TaxID=6233 RepID=A0A7E4W1U0_PANRE
MHVCKTTLPAIVYQHHRKASHNNPASITRVSSLLSPSTITVKPGPIPSSKLTIAHDLFLATKESQTVGGHY